MAAQNVFVESDSAVWLADYALNPGQPATVAVYHTTDEGTTWTHNFLHLKHDPAAYAGSGSLFFLSSNDGWLLAKHATSAAFSGGDLYHTMDGGTTWVEQSIPIAGTLSFTTADDGWVAGGVASSYLYVTHDGGSTWNAEGVPGQPDVGPGQVEFSAPHFFDSQNGVMLLNVRRAQDEIGLQLFKTSDGGRSWLLSGSATASGAGDVFVDGYAATMALVDLSNWFLYSDRLYATVDGGQTWSPISTQQDLSGTQRLVFSTQVDGWLFTSSTRCTDKRDCQTKTQLLETTDGGQTWTRKSID